MPVDPESKNAAVKSLYAANVSNTIVRAIGPNSYEEVRKKDTQRD
jgi:hypothetical protein